MNEFVKYLNGLHNYYAQNQNAYGERNVESPFYAKTMVPIRVCDYIISSINNIEPHIIILTGHAGDGKTSIMFQVIDRLGAKADSLEPIQEIVTESGRSICCIKDFSELSDSRKKETLQNAISLLAQGKYVFMVANTGPLINTFGSMFSEKKESDAAKMALIEATSYFNKRFPIGAQTTRFFSKSIQICYKSGLRICQMMLFISSRSFTTKVSLPVGTAGLSSGKYKILLTPAFCAHSISSVLSPT